MTQKRFFLSPCLFILFFGVSIQVLAQRQSPYKNLLTAAGIPVFDTIAGIGLDINESNPQALHGDVSIQVIVPGGSNLPYVYQIGYVPAPGFVGVDTFVLEFRFANMHPYLTYRAFRVSVMPSKILANPDYVSTQSSHSIQINPLNNDWSTAGSLTLRSIALVNHGTAHIEGQSGIVFTPDPGFLGMAHLNYVVCDALNTCQTGTVSVGVHDGTPDIEPLQIYTKKNTRIRVPLTVAGYSIVQSPQSGLVAMESNGQVLSYVPGANFTGNDQFVLRTVKNGVPYLKTIAVKVYAVEQANFMAMNDLYFTPKGIPLTFNVKSNDVGNLQVRSLAIPPNFPGTLSNNFATGQITFTPNPNFSGVATFQYRLGNGFVPALETAEVSIVVDNLALQPKLPNVLQTPESTPLVLRYPVPFNFNFEILSAPIYGALQYYPGFSTLQLLGQEISGHNLLVYTPQPGYQGVEELAVRYCTPNNQCQLTKFQVEVIPPSGANPECITECVWPGDVDGDGLVSSRDMLPLGHLIGVVGPDRPQQDAWWYGHAAADWNNPFFDRTVDLKHADTDGNGIIEQADVAAIAQQMARAHNFPKPSVRVGKGLPIGMNLLTEHPELGVPMLIEFTLGNDQVPAIDIYGITFELNLAPGLIDTFFRMDFYQNSWLNYDAPYLNLAQRSSGNRYEMAFSRTNGLPVSGQGVIGSAELIIIDIIEGGGQDGKPTITLTPTIHLMDGSSYNSEPVVLELPIRDRSRRISSVEPDSIALYPNPATERLVISWEAPVQENTDGATLRVLNLQGRVCLQQQAKVSQLNAELDIRGLQSGFYLLELKTNTTRVFQKFQVIR